MHVISSGASGGKTADVVAAENAAAKAEMLSLDGLRRYFRSLDEALPSIGLVSLGTPAMMLLAAAAAMYLLQAGVAIAAGRHLFGDASWFLLKMLSENHVAYWHTNLWHDFFVGRIGAFTYQEYPTLLASRMGVRSLQTLAIIYGVTLFSFKPISILLCYRFARDKRYIIFPLAALFAGTMNSEAFLCSETHLMSALFWPALFGLLYLPELRRFDLFAMVVVSAPLLLCYETMAAFGLMLCAAYIYRLLAISKDARDKWLTLGFCVWYGLGVVFAALAILYPRDPTNRSDFARGLLFLFRYPHVGARISCVVLVLCAMILTVPAAYKKTLQLLLAISMVCSAAIPAFILLHPERTSLGIHIAARTMNASIPLLLAVVFLAVHFRLFDIAPEKYRLIFIGVAVLGICQSCWSLLATRQWSNMLGVLRAELRNHVGPVAFKDSPLSMQLLDGQPMRQMHADWPLLALSIVYADHGKVRSILLPPNSAFQPFDPFDPAALPRLQRFGIDYSMYAASLPKSTPYQLGQWIDFGEKGNSITHKTGGWWDAESWGAWSAEQAGITINMAEQPKSDLVLEAPVGAFVNTNHPSVDVQVLVNDVSAGRWKFRFNDGVPHCEMYRMPISQKTFTRASPAVIRFRVTGARSPESLGLGADSRMLGLGVCRMRLLPQ